MMMINWSSPVSENALVEVQVNRSTAINRESSVQHPGQQWFDMKHYNSFQLLFYKFLTSSDDYFIVYCLQKLLPSTAPLDGDMSGKAGQNYGIFMWERKFQLPAGHTQFFDNRNTESPMFFLHDRSSSFVMEIANWQFAISMNF